MDSGASQHFIKSAQTDLLKNVKIVNNGPNIQLPNKETLQVSHEGQIKLFNTLPSTAQKAYITKLNQQIASIGRTTMRQSLYGGI